MRNDSTISVLRFIVAGTIALFMSACMTKPPEAPLPEEVTWVSYQSAEMGFSIEIPIGWKAEHDEHIGGVIFRQDGYPVLLITLLDEQASARRGLWADHQDKSIGTDTIAGLTAQRYAYPHPDIVFVMPTIAWVLPWQEKNLEIAFRTSLNEPAPLHQAILNSLQLDIPDV